LAALLLREQGLDITLVCFTTPFFSSQHAEASARQMDMDLIIVDITEEHLKLLHNPPHGFGAHLNPCIDCHALMLRRAGAMLSDTGARFVFSGEVLGQRPFSQNKDALAAVARDSGLNDLLLRPLSARLLPITRPEREGWVDRDRLLDISGRSRKRQMKLAGEYGFVDYPTPAGGCLLTEEGFSQRLRDLFDRRALAPELREIEMLKVGRHFRLTPETRLIVGRNQAENERLESLSAPEDDVLSCELIPGPVGVIPKGTDSNDALFTAALITASYSDAETGSVATVQVTRGDAVSSLAVAAPPKEEFKDLMI